MKLLQKNTLTLSLILAVLVPTSFALADHNDDSDDNRLVKISLTNISNTVFTPPIFALCNQRMAPIAVVGEPASNLIEPLAEGGDTSGLAGLFADNNCSTIALSTPVLPGETITVELEKGKYLHMASMLLPTNDGFIFTSGRKVKKVAKRGMLKLRSYDAGTEINDELCANIPGPQCGGEPFNPERLDNNFVRPHPGIQGFADVSAQDYNWGEPVAIINVQ